MPAVLQPTPMCPRSSPGPATASRILRPRRFPGIFLLHCSARERRFVKLNCADIQFKWGFSRVTDNGDITMSSFVQNATIVLVHGAWADGSCWHNIILPLRKEGLKVTCAPDSPHVANGRHSRSPART